MFWGLVLKANKRYSQRVTKAFHVSQATLDTSTINDDKSVVQIWVTIDDADHLIGNVSGRQSHLAMDVTFTEGESVAFYSKGSGIVHLTGYLLPEDDLLPGMGEDADEESDDEAVQLNELESVPSKKHEKLNNKKAAKPEQEDSDDDDEDDDDSDDIGADGLLEELEDEEAEDEEDSDDDEDMEDDDEDEDDDDDDGAEEEDDEEDDDIKAPPSKMAKFEKSANQNGLTNGKLAKKDHDQKKQQQQQQHQKDKKHDQKQEQKQKNQQQQQQKGPNVKVLQQGVAVEDIRPGKGPEAKIGRKVSVYYEGRLKSNGKVFDSTKSGDGFKFQLGRGEVIRGWDIGIVGMRVGSKRRITCPPNVAYGAKGQAPVIPGNATLVFDVELRGVN